ncbi:MAG: hypothetical protein PVF15_04885 [Candidatus Bathyarchaeota archaeon]|jgi:hypothetical protein
MKSYKRTLATLFILAIIILSASWINPLTAQEPPPEKPPEEGPPLEDMQFNGTFIGWNTEEDTVTDQWTWQSQAWEFGPYPTFAIYLQNGTEVTDINFVPLGEPFKISIEVAKTIFTGNTTLGRAGLNWHAELRATNGSNTGSAHCRVVYVNEMVTQYWNETDTWHIESFVFNKSETLAPPGEPLPPMEEGGEISFYKFDENLSTVTETSDMWRIDLVGTFNTTTTPTGPFWVDLEVTDSWDNWIDFGYSAWTGKISPHRMVAVGKPGLVYGGFSDTWTFEKLDMENRSVYSVSRGALWKMRVNVTSADLVNVTLAFDLDWGVKTYANVTGWYQETVTEYGGWMYNETADTYYWNSTVPVTRTEEKYGPHLEERWTNVPHERWINVTRHYWDPMTGEEKYENVTEFVHEKIFLIYDHTTESFTIKQGYSYWFYDPEQHRDRDQLVLYPLNTSDPTTRFYNLSANDCSYQQIGPDEHVIEFVGAFSNTTFSDRNEYWIQEPMVYGTYDRIWANWETISPSDFEIAVDTLVAITSVFDQNGQEVKWNMFQIDPEEAFTIQSKLQGANVRYKDIHGVGVAFRTGEGHWISESENYWSDVEIRLVYDITNDDLTSVTYNWTHKDAYVYGPHRGWELVNKTDWHEEYNEETGEWDWVESPYLEWNETTITDWHWEHLVLNQTEYRRDPNSSNAWINREEEWIPDEDRAFMMPTSYANLNSANISLIEGIVTVNLNIAFTSEAPQRNYWWDIGFKTLAYGPDWSQGWGEHTVEEWTSESVYHVNGTATGNQIWYVTSPSTPRYTIYNGERHKLEESPYITIGGNDLLIRTRTHYDWGSGEDRVEYVLRDPYDPEIGEEPRYYELANGTKVFITEAYQVLIRTLTLNDTGAYRIDGVDTTPVPNGTAFSTFMDHAEQDWSKEYWNETLQHHVAPYYYELLNGTRIYRDEAFEIQNYNMTTNRWDVSNPTYTENATSLLVDRVGNGVALNYTYVVLLREHNCWWQPLPDGTGYYLVMKNGTRIIHSDPWSVPDEQRMVTINGVDYQISWPTEYYNGTYDGKSFLIRGGGWEGYVRPFYYTELGTSNGVKYELPYPGAMALSWWDLEGIESEGRKLKTVMSFTVDGTTYRLYLSEDQRDYFIMIGDTRVDVTWPMKDIGFYYAEINGEEHWDLAQVGWTLKLGTNVDRSGQFEAELSFTTKTGYDPTGRMWNEHNRYGYDRENATLYLEALNGTRYDLHSAIFLMIWEVQIGNETYFTMDQWERWEPVYIPETGETLQKPYIITLNGTKVYFEWETQPASWVDEIHLKIPGANYTRLTPFSWQMQPICDTAYIFNMTIPEDSGNPGHTSVFYENGIEVPINATFKAFGTHWGPGVRQDYHHEGDQWTPDAGGHMHGTEAPWNSSLHVNYIIGLNGTRIYSEDFGWRGDRWESFKRWDFNGATATANVSAAVVEGGYAIYLNDTTTVDVTSRWPQGGWPDQYLIMKNGTYFNVHWNEAIHRYITVINNNTYLFRDVVVYYNLTHLGTVYRIVDPINPDPNSIVSYTYHQMPTISSDRQTWLWMNATSDSVLHDTGYYLINASDMSRLNLELVSDWWISSESAWKDLFRNKGLWELEESRPRYNITINGQEYFVIDPSPVVDRWDGEMTIEHNTYRYPESIDVTLGGTTYTIDLFEGGYWRNDLRWRRYETITLSDGTTFEVEDQHRWKPAYQVLIDTELLDVQLEEMNIYKRHTMWGEIYRWMLTDLNVHSVQSIWDIVVGTPGWGMWGIRAFEIVSETGAVDLDGDLTTTNDQYFVRRIHTGSDLWNRTENRMFVELIWDPNSSMIGDEMHIGAWMGKVHVSWKFEWTETYIWYYASNMSTVTPTTMQEINATLTDSATGLPNPGYWDIGHMVRNSTWADILERAEREHWDWIEDNTNEWEWIWFGTQQDYQTSWTEGDAMQTAGIGLRYEFAGLFLYQDSEQTHFFMPKSVSNITFVTPGEAFGNINATGDMVVDGDETITFGFTCNDVNGTLFPYNEQRSMWGWWDGMIHGADFDAPDLTKKPTESSVDEISFAIHFSANATEENELNNEASMKIDQRVGDWNLDHDVIDGRQENVSGNMVYLRGNDVFMNRSLAISYYVTAFTGIAWNVKDEEGSMVDNNNVTESSSFDVAAKLANAKFASVRLGSTYDWSKPIAVNDTIRTFNVTSKTTPVGSFKASFESESGKSSTGFDISAMMYFLTVEFPRWDGYAVYNDPEVLLHLSKGTVYEAPPEEGLIAELAQRWWIWALIGSAAAAAVVLVVFRSKVKGGLSRLRRSIGSKLHRGKAKAGPDKPTRVPKGPKPLG